MSTELILTLIILIVAIILFLSEKLPIDLIALLVLIALGFTHILSPSEVFSGLSDPAVITLLAIFILAHSLEVTGIAESIGNFMVRTARGNETRLIFTLMSTAAFMSLFMNNIAVASILLPAASTIARKSKINISTLLMPLAFATLLGGTATLFTTTNIVASTVLREHGYKGFGVLDFAPVGIPIAVVGILYMTFVGRKILHKVPAEERAEVIRQAESDLLHLYSLGDRLFRARIPADSFLINKELSQSTLRELYGLNLVAVERDGSLTLSPPPEFTFRENDILLVEGRLEEFTAIDKEPYLEILPKPATDYQEVDLESASITILEVVLSPRSNLIGRTLRESRFRDKYGMSVLAIWNSERIIRTRLGEHVFAFGDALLIQGLRDNLSMLRLNPDLIVLKNGGEKVRKYSNKGGLALAIFGITLLVATFGPFSIGEVMLAGAITMIIFRVLTMEEAYRVIDWRIIFLVAGMLPLGIAMTKTGVTALLATTLTNLLHPYGPTALLFGLLILTVILSQAMKGAAVSAVIVPVAIQAAVQFNVDPRAMTMGVALATSLAFVTPLGHPVNILMMGPGGYRFKDFFKIGLPLTIILFIVIMIFLPMAWPFHWQ